MEKWFLNYNELDGTFQWWESITSWRKRTKIEKYKKSLKPNNIKSFKTIRYKLTALSNINNLILT